MPPSEQREIIDRLARYELSCSVAGLRDVEVVADHGPRTLTRLLAGLALFPPMWLLTAWLTPWNSWWARTLVIVAAPILGLIAVRALERAIEVSRAGHGWVTRLERQQHLERLREQRRALTDLIDRHRAA